jgi:hypothetical protein
MEADRILLALEAYLTPKVIAAGGSLQVADNPWEVVDLLRVTPEKWRLILSFEDEDSVHPRNAGGWTAGNVSLYVQMHKGFSSNRGETIYKTTPAGRVSMTKMAGQIRQWMREIQFPDNDDIAKDDQSHFAFMGASWVDGTEEKGKPWRVRRLDFQLVYALDDPGLDENPDGENVSIPDAFRITGISEDGSAYIVSLNGAAVGRVPRYAPGEDDPAGTGTGWRITAIAADPGFYVVCLSGLPDGRIPRFEA